MLRAFKRLRNEFLVVIENCTDDKLTRFSEELQKEIEQYNRTSGGYEIKIKIEKILNGPDGFKDFRQLVASLYEMAKV